VKLFVTERLASGVQVDLTRKQVATDKVTWQVRSTTDDGERLRGQVEARFTAGKVARIRLGGPA